MDGIKNIPHQVPSVLTRRVCPGVILLGGAAVHTWLSLSHWYCLGSYLLPGRGQRGFGEGGGCTQGMSSPLRRSKPFLNGLSLCLPIRNSWENWGFCLPRIQLFSHQHSKISDSSLSNPTVNTKKTKPNIDRIHLKPKYFSHSQF